MNIVLQRSLLWLLAIIPVLAGCAEIEFRRTGVEIHTTAGQTVSYNVELAETEAQKRRGLMHRERLPADEGMLFLYDPVRETSMWMKNTPLPLDILFIDPEGRIVRIEENTTPMSTQTLSSGEKVRAVLELNAGQAEKHGISVGDRVRW